MAPEPVLSQTPSRSRGVALIIGLVILAVLSLIGVAAFSISTQEERMAGNSRDRMRAFEAAEAALRNCETYVASGAAAFDGSDGTYPRLQSSAGTPGSTGTPITESAAAQSETGFWQNAASARQLLDANGNPFNGNSKAPSCIAEQFLVPNAFYSPGVPLGPGNSVTIAHVTAHGYGTNPNTIVRLESYVTM